MAVIVTDSTCDLPAEVLRALDITCVPVTLHAGGRRWLDGQEVGPQEIAQLLERDEVLRSSPPRVEGFEATYHDLLARHEQVLSIHLSGRLSGTVERAREAARRVGEPERLTVLDAGVTSLPLGTVVRVAAQALQAGWTGPEVVSLVHRAAAEQFVEFTLRSLKYMRRGGYVRRSQELAGNILNIRPVLGYNADALVTLRHVRARDAARDMVHSLESTFPDEPVDVVLGYSFATGPHTDRLLDLLHSSRVEVGRLEVRPVGAVLSAYIGPGAYGLSALPTRLVPRE